MFGYDAQFVRRLDLAGDVHGRRGVFADAKGDETRPNAVDFAKIGNLGCDLRFDLIGDLFPLMTVAGIGSRGDFIA